MQELIALAMGGGSIGLLLDIKYRLGSIVTTQDHHERRITKLEGVKA
jgi:hypothetical protein